MFARKEKSMTEKEDKLMENLAVNVAIYRTKANLTPKKLSRVIGKPPDFIDKLENLKLTRVPSLYVILAISCVLNVGLNDLTNENYIESLLEEA